MENFISFVKSLRMFGRLHVERIFESIHYGEMKENSQLVDDGRNLMACGYIRGLKTGDLFTSGMGVPGLPVSCFVKSAFTSNQYYLVRLIVFGSKDSSNIVAECVCKAR